MTAPAAARRGPVDVIHVCGGAHTTWYLILIEDRSGTRYELCGYYPIAGWNPGDETVLEVLAGVDVRCFSFAWQGMAR